MVQNQQQDIYNILFALFHVFFRITADTGSDPAGNVIDGLIRRVRGREGGKGASL